MKSTFLSRLHRNGVFILVGALLLLLGIPLYQLLVLSPGGYDNALASVGNGVFTSYLLWIGAHLSQFLGYRALLILSFACLVNLPFTLFRIIVAQEILEPIDDQVVAGQDQVPEEAESDKTTDEDTEVEDKDVEEPVKTEETAGRMPTDAWRGKGFAVIAAWSGLLAIVLYTLGTLASTIYFATVGSQFSPHMPLPGGFSVITSILTIIPNSIGIGFLALSSLLFGAVIARRGRNLWPTVWVFFGYTALAVAALLSGSAVAVASVGTTGQSLLTTPAIVLLALWVLWFGVMLVRLKPEA
jgi:hypothetical protein